MHSSIAAAPSCRLSLLITALWHLTLALSLPPLSPEPPLAPAQSTKAQRWVTIGSYGAVKVRRRRVAAGGGRRVARATATRCGAARRSAAQHGVFFWGGAHGPPLWLSPPISFLPLNPLTTTPPLANRNTNPAWRKLCRSLTRAPRSKAAISSRRRTSRPSRSRRRRRAAKEGERQRARGREERERNPITAALAQPRRRRRGGSSPSTLLASQSPARVGRREQQPRRGPKQNVGLLYLPPPLSPLASRPFPIGNRSALCGFEFKTALAQPRHRGPLAGGKQGRRPERARCGTARAPSLRHRAASKTPLPPILPPSLSAFQPPFPV